MASCLSLVSIQLDSARNQLSSPARSVANLIPGCPAAGKGTLLGRLAQDPDLAQAHLYHLSIGDHLRELRAKGTLPASASQDLAEQNLISGATLVALIKTKVSKEWRRGARIFLLDGFPRNQEQMDAFLDKVSSLPLTLRHSPLTDP